MAPEAPRPPAPAVWRGWSSVSAPSTKGMGMGRGGAEVGQNLSTHPGAAFTASIHTHNQTNRFIFCDSSCRAGAGNIRGAPIQGLPSEGFVSGLTFCFWLILDFFFFFFLHSTTASRAGEVTGGFRGHIRVVSPSEGFIPPSFLPQKEAA